MSRHALIIAPLLALVFVGLGVWSRGVWKYDEAHFLLVANTICRGVLGMLSGVPYEPLKDSIMRNGGSLNWLAKPGQPGLIALLGILTGGVSDTKALLLGLFSTVGTVALVQSLAARVAGVRAGLIAGCLCATAPLFVIYGRTALGIPTAVFFGVLALWILLSEWKRPRLMSALAGVSVTVAIACHYNVVVMLGVAAIAIWTSVDARRRGPFFIGAAATVLFVEVCMMIAGHWIRPRYAPYQTWIDSVTEAYILYQAPGAVLRGAVFFDGARGYGADAWALLMRIWSVGIGGVGPLAIMAAYMLMQEKSDSEVATHRVAIAWALVPAILWSLYPWKVERSFPMAIPGMALCAGIWLGKWKSEQAALAVAGLIILANTTALLPELTKGRSPYARTVEANEKLLTELPRGGVTNHSFNHTSLPLWKWYLGARRGAEGLPTPFIDFRSPNPPTVRMVDCYTLRIEAGSKARPPMTVPAGNPVFDRDGHRYAFELLTNTATP